MLKVNSICLCVTIALIFVVSTNAAYPRSYYLGLEAGWKDGMKEGSLLHTLKANFVYFNKQSHVKRGKILTRKIPTSKSYTYMFYIYPHSKAASWRSILHHGKYNTHRSPAFWFYPGTTRLHIRTSSSKSWNSGIDPTYHLPLQKWTHVAITLTSKGYLRVYYNGVLKGKGYVGTPTVYKGPLYAGDPWHYAAVANLYKVAYYNHALSRFQVRHQMNKYKKQLAIHHKQRAKNYISVRKTHMKLQKGKILTRKLPLLKTFTYSFWIYPHSKTTSWGSILHHGKVNTQRTPGIWFWPKQTKLHVIMSSSTSWNSGLNTKAQVPLRKWTHIAVVVSASGFLKVYFNGKLKGSVKIGKPTVYAGPLYAGDPWHGVANANIHDLRVYKTDLTGREIRSMLKHGKASRKKKIKHFNGGTTWCDCVNKGAMQGYNKWYLCPKNKLMTGWYRHNGQYLNSMKKFKCCGVCRGKTRLKSGTCHQAHWVASFDRAGWSKCPHNTYVRGFYKSSCNWIYCLEYAYCCKIKGSRGYKSRKSVTRFAHQNDYKGWKIVNKNNYITGLYRSNGHYLYNIEYVQEGLPRSH